MTIPFQIKDTIDARRSIRSYQMKPVDRFVMDALKEFAKTMPVPFEHAVEIRFFHADPASSLYPLMKSPPDNIAFLSATDPVSLSKVGFVGEMLILYAWSKGLSTCWHGHYKLAELERLVPQLKEANMGFGYSAEGIRAICLTPLGYYKDSGLRLMDRITKKTFSHKRKELVELLENKDDFNHLTKDVLHALDLGRRAPSALNSQLWRFGFEDGFRTIIIAMSEEYRHVKWEHPNVDIGICACHVWLGLIDGGHDPKVVIYEDSGRAVWKISI
ncbi:MAG: hypothetical protein GX261_03380 [Spirochaetales bacterium]|jgi:nitroreductase|nr:hypothetical protein [Spirochaetales bacterium]